MKKSMKRLLSGAMETIAVTILLVLFAATATAQTEVTGRVTDSKKGTGIAGVSVSVKGKNVATQTGNDGTFKLTAPAGSTTLTFTSVGFATQDVAVGGGVVNVGLVESSQQLSDVVVIGYGTARKKDLTGSVTTVAAKDFNKGVITTAEQLIAGKVAGVSVTQNDGAPGSGGSIRIRGGSSLNASNDPLYVIDGMPIQNPKNPDGSNSVPGVANPLALINPNDIASITILKDASATAIYGSRASNGVVLITTKKGQSGKPKFNFTTQLSAGTLAKEFNNFSPDEFRAFVNTHGSPEQIALLGTANTNWQKEIYQTAITTDNNLSVSGSLKKLPYRLSVGYLNQNGILKTGNLQRVTTGLNLNPVLFNGNLKIDLSVRASLTKTRFANADAVGGANSFDPTQPVYSGNNRFGGYWERLDSQNTNTGLAALSPKNPVGLLMQKIDKGTANRVIANAAFDYKMHFFPDLHAIANVGYDYAKGYGNVTINDSAAATYKTSTSPYDNSVHSGQRTHYQSNVNNSYLNGYLSYSKTFNRIHRIEAIAGVEYQRYLTTNYNFTPYAYDTAATSKPNQYAFDKPENRLLSYLGRVNYVFNDALFLTGSVRRDGSSKFSSANRWGTFPSGAIAWRISELPGLKNSKTLSNLKLRLGYGITGQQDGIGNYDYISYYKLSDFKAEYQFGGVYYQMYRPEGYYANRKWEQTATTNAAIDYGFFNNRINGSLEFYYKKTTDLLNQITQPAFTNFSNTIIANIGSMENRGVEFSINAQPIVSKNVTWDVAFNVTYNKNKITGLDFNNVPGLVNQIAGIGGNGGVQANAIGSPRGSFYVFQQIYNKETGMPIENLYEDINRDGQITSKNDLVIFKSSDPKMFFGFSSSLSYKKWNVGFNMRAHVGNYLYNNVATNGASSKFLFQNYLANQSDEVLNTNFEGLGNFYQSSYYVQNASFIKMDNVNVGYNAGKISKGVSLRFTAGVQNVFTITKYKGLDPEVNGGIDNNQYPRPRTVLLGVGLDF
jgi:TonB-linked SusC/RagA family outer membrane protein